MSNPFANGPQGQPGQPQPGQPPYGQPQPNFYAGPPAPQPAPKPWKKLLRFIVPAIVLIVVAVGYFVSNKDSAQKADVGDCLTSTKDADDVKTTGCDSSNAAFRVIEKFKDSSSTSKCDTPELNDKGYVGAYYWSGSGKGVLCFTITKHTTVQDLQNLEPGVTQEDLDDLRATLDKQGVPGVK